MRVSRSRCAAEGTRSDRSRRGADGSIGMHGHLVRHARKPRRRSRIRVMNGETPVCTNAHTIDHGDIRLGGSTGLTRGSDHDCSQDSCSGGALHDRRRAVGRHRKRRRAHPGAPRGGAETGQNNGQPTTRRRMMGARAEGTHAARDPLRSPARRRGGRHRCLRNETWLRSGLVGIDGSGGGTRTPDTRIMIATMVHFKPLDLVSFQDESCCVAI